MILPAIDIMDGKCVRLYQGRASDVTVYSDDPAAAALRWEGEGAEYLHVVDLDGAFEGSPKNMDAVREIVESVNIPVELGGGIRDAKAIDQVLASGVDRVIIGTRACDLDFLRDVMERFGAGVVVGIDAKNGMVSVRGWEEVTSLTALDFAKQVEDAGARTVIYTDVARDGALKGPNIGAVEKMLERVGIDVIASGGVTTAADVRSLCGLARKGLSGIIIGKALYDNRIDLKEALEIAKGC